MFAVNRMDLLLPVLLLFANGCSPETRRSDVDRDAGDGKFDVGSQDGGSADASSDASDLDARVYDSGADAAKDAAVTDAGTEARIPPLRPIAQTKAEELAAYARRLRVSSTGEANAVDMAWSLINLQCTDRAQAISIALAEAPTGSLVGLRPTWFGDEVSEARLKGLVASPTYDSARIWVNGPLVTEQTLVTTSGDHGPEPQYWPYHVGTVVNVEGEMMVIDLSVSDTPLKIDAWLSGFVDPTAQCQLIDEDDAFDHWLYWNQAGASIPGFDPTQPTPSPACVYYFTPLLQNRWDAEPMHEVWAGQLLAQSHVDQSKVFQAVLGRYGVSSPNMASVLSRYEARSIDWMCEDFGDQAGYPVCSKPSMP